MCGLTAREVRPSSFGFNRKTDSLGKITLPEVRGFWEGKYYSTVSIFTDSRSWVRSVAICSVMLPILLNKL